MTLALRCRLSHQGGVHPIRERGSPERITEASLEDQYWEAGDEREMKRWRTGSHLDRVIEATAIEDRNRAGWIERTLELLDEQVRELTERIAEGVRQTWDRNRSGIGRDSGPDIDWSR